MEVGVVGLIVGLEESYSNITPHYWVILLI